MPPWWPLTGLFLVDHLDGVVFAVWQVCRLVGITKMQLNYWTERATITTAGAKQRLYDASAVELLMLIKQGRDLGFDVPTAIRAAHEFLRRSRLEYRSDELVAVSRAA